MFRAFGIWRSKTKACFLRLLAEYTLIEILYSPYRQFDSVHLMQSRNAGNFGEPLCLKLFAQEKLGKWINGIYSASYR